MLVRLALRPAISEISHILSFPIDYHVKRPKTESPKFAKNLQFKISLFF